MNCRKVAAWMGAAAMLIDAAASPASAGMPIFSLTDIARMRLSSISFFLLVLLLSAWAVQGMWNALSKDFPRLPRMTYGRALAAIALWGFLFVLVLTMISGARELLTPGAWEKTGLTYQVVGAPKPTDRASSTGGGR